jgi:hypothetical protein
MSLALVVWKTTRQNVEQPHLTINFGQQHSAVIAGDGAPVNLQHDIPALAPW